PTLVCALAALVALCAPSPAGAVSVPEIFARAARAEARGDERAAASALEELVAAGVDSDGVLYDLGTVYARSGRYGEAIWRLEQGTRRSPLAVAAARNLRATRLRLARRDAARSGHAVVETYPGVWIVIGELLPLDWVVPL